MSIDMIQLLRQCLILNLEPRENTIRHFTNEAREGNGFGTFYYDTMGQSTHFAWVADERAQMGKKKLENTLRPLILD